MIQVLYLSTEFIRGAQYLQFIIQLTNDLLQVFNLLVNNTLQ